ncbi:hypothetical protein [Natrarchaeobaculum aegyptiacum]|uniref:Uncharacterized protein n=1 Tax=Natrarchaeobaculum aegyptiacum TaxID=745377 RepID=A0A2Z2I320_9EURY|nr:hypothetical protein [Natrarchaeobaculum aegyptiacum]ARS91548.1 hypothetical protein B1756_18685 [Natrarchaeobaculum aegyptiacum]
MKWRCTWCGKPHESNDPPCDECGHNVFEEAVVRADPDEDDGTVDTGITYVWRCQNCGRDHVRNNPPCSRCGNHDLEKREQTYDEVDSELETPSWLEVARPYLPVFAVVAIVLALFVTGIIPPSILPGIGQPSPPDAPGDANAAAGLEFETTEAEIYAQLEADREVERTADDGLAGFAEFYNRNVVREQTGTDAEGVDPREFGLDPNEPFALEVVGLETDLGGYEGETELAGVVADALVDAGGDDVLGEEYDAEGVDLHYHDGTLFVVYVAQ